MKAKVIETGEIVEVNLYSDPYYKEKGQGYDRRGWYEDELEFPPGPKMVSLDKVCEFLKNIIDDNIATLNINETSCSLAKFMMSCLENRAVISGLGKQISIFPYHREYKIKYADKNRIIFSEEYPTLSEVSGEIDLNSKTLIYTVKNAGINRNETRKIEVITDNAKIQELEKKIISKYLRKRMFER